MKIAALSVFLFLISLSASASPAPSVQQIPTNCRFSCEGWNFKYVGQRPDHADDVDVFVANKQQRPPNDKNDWAKTQEEARKIADTRADSVIKQYSEKTK